MDKKELRSQLLQVRKAYRLLYDYQKHVLDLVRFVGNYLGYTTVQGYPVFSGAAPREGKKDVFDLWSWDWLNMYHYKFNFGAKKVGDQDIFLAVHIISDTGYYAVKGGDKTEVKNFKTPEDSATRLVLYASEKEYKWKDLYEAKPFNSDSDEYYETLNGNKIYGRAYDLSEFINSEETIKSVKRFKQDCITRSILM